MTCYGAAVWLFPFGAAPDLTSPVEVFRNGLMQWMGGEAKLVRVGSKKPLTVVVFDPPTHEGDVVQASYVAMPEEGR